MESRALERELVSRFYRGNGLNLGIAAVAALAGGTLNIAVSWLMQQLIDTASGVSGAYPLEELAFLTGVFILVCFASFMLKYASEPRFIEKALRQYKDFAFKKLTEKNISSFKDESTAAYLSAMTNDVGSIEADWSNIDSRAIREAAARVRARTHEKCLFFVISDGAPCEPTRNVKEAVRELSRDGFSFVSIGIDFEYDPSEMYDNHVSMTDLSTLAPELGKMIKKAIVSYPRLKTGACKSSG